MVWDVFNASHHIKIIQDLCNNDKHGYPPTSNRGMGNSGVAPQLTNVRRVLRVAAGSSPGQQISVFMIPGSGIQKFGDGSAKAVVTGEVIDKDGKPVGDLYAIEMQAVKDWEDFLSQFGVKFE
jgi:hypothetical protein